MDNIRHSIPLRMKKQGLYSLKLSKMDWVFLGSNNLRSKE